MMKGLRYLFMVSLLASLTFAGGCTDDLLEYGPDGFPVGETDIEMEMDLEAVKVSGYASRAAVFPAGTKAGTVGDPACNTIPDDDLCVIAFDADGNLLKGFPVRITSAEHGLTFSDPPRTDADASNGKTDQTSTRRARFKLKDMPYGKYYIYGVSNLYTSAGDIDTYHELTVTHKDEILHKDDFLAISRSFSTSDFRRNCELIGYFTDGKEKNAPGSEVKLKEQYVAIDRPGMTLHSWLRRACAIVSIDFDGSNLRDNIKIYIKRATIHNVPTSIILGSKSAVQNSDGMYRFRDGDERPTPDGQWIEYSQGDSETSWNFISNGHPKLTSGQQNEEIDFHGPAAPCFYVYENMQGDGDDTQLKPQQPSDDGLVKDSKDKYDNMELGTYIEVEGYYDLSSNTQVSRGPIRYRFMLGKDIDANFDVERNHHYKITMMPRGNGNDVDWHIEYNEKDGWEVRNPYYVSYLYNHDSTLRFRYTPQNGEEVVSLDAEIVGNNWWPDGDTGYAGTTQATQFPVSGEVTNEQLMAEPNKYQNQFGRNIYTGTVLNGRAKYLGNGFLSLHPTEKTNLNYADTKHNDGKSGDDFSYTKDEDAWVNDWYFYGKTDASGGIDRSRRSYSFANSSTGGTGRDQYTMKKDPVGEGVTFNIPVFTRAKNLVKKSAYTGNNPFTAYTRSAYVKLTVHLRKNGTTTTKSEVVRVEQVKRIVNPKAVYRKENNNENFHVVLKELTGENNPNFQDVESDGPWMAEVIGDANFINLNGRQTIKGASNSAIDFTIRFNKMNRGKKVRNAVVRVRYNNYSCVHLIFVRQGYDPQTIGGTTLWRTCNLVADGAEAEDPRDEGSLFKFGNTTTAIDVASNDMPLINLTASSFPAQGQAPGQTGTKFYKASDSRTISETDMILWGDIVKSDGGFKDHNVATMEQFQELYYDPSNKIQQGFGVLYADGATETADNIYDAYGYYRHDPASVRGKKGMRGVIVYYWDRQNQNDPENCKSVFFPIGRSGFGHRKESEKFGDAWNSPSESGLGTLRYCCGRRNFFPYLTTAPLFYDLFRRPGAIYYSRYKMKGALMADGTQEKNENGSFPNSIGLDTNYFSLDFNSLTESNVGNGADACFLRCVGTSFK